MKHLILIAHGSRDSRWREPFEKLSRSLDDQASLCYMEFVSPTFEEVVKEKVSKGITSFKLLPLFMSGGGHVGKDIPKQVDDLKSKYSIDIEVLEPIGESPEVAKAILGVCESNLN